MAIYRKTVGGVWYFSVYAGEGKRLRGTTGKKSRAEALLVEQTMRLAASRKSPKEHIIKIIEALYGDSPRQDPVPLESAFGESERIRATRGRELSPKASRTVGAHFGMFYRWVRRARPKIADAREVDRATVQAFATHLELAGKSCKTRRNIIGELSAVWNEIRHGHDDFPNPWPLALPARRDEGRGEAFTPEEARRVFVAADAAGHGWGLACRIAAATGLRYGDVVRLRHADIGGGVLTVVPRKTAKSSGAVVSVPLPRGLLDEIGAGDGPLFPEQLAEYEKWGHFFTFPFSRVLGMAGVDRAKYTFHSFRHFFRTQLSRAGVSDEIAMKLGGWTQRETADRYDHDGRAREKAEAVAAAWALTAGGT